MKRYFLIIALLTLSFGVRAAAPTDSTALKAEAAYTMGEFNQAITLYENLLDTGEHSAILYYNLGNAYFKNDMLGAAILNYSRALRLDASMEDARYNLDVASARTIDKIESVPDFFVVSYLEGLRRAVSGNTWAVLSLVFLLIALAGVVVWLVLGSLSYRKVGFTTGVVFAICAVVAFWCSLVSYDEVHNSSSAVVINTAAPVVSAPTSDSKDLFVLHEGTAVEVIERSDKWSEIQISNGEKGWIESHSIEII